jgi:uncharacterized DUF497 family protein
MHIELDPAKDAASLVKHGVSLALAAELEWAEALVWPDVRHDYGETRMVALVPMGMRLYAVVFVDRFAVRRVISLRKANTREVKFYGAND